MFLVTEAPAREIARALPGQPGKGRAVKDILSSLTVSLLSLLFFLCMSSSQVPHAQVPDVQPVCPNEAPLSRIWMAANHPPGIPVHEGTTTVQH